MKVEETRMHRVQRIEARKQQQRELDEWLNELNDTHEGRKSNGSSQEDELQPVRELHSSLIEQADGASRGFTEFCLEVFSRMNSLFCCKVTLVIFHYTPSLLATPCFNPPPDLSLKPSCARTARNANAGVEPLHSTTTSILL